MQVSLVTVLTVVARVLPLLQALPGELKTNATNFAAFLTKVSANAFLRSMLPDWVERGIDHMIAAANVIATVELPDLTSLTGDLMAGLSILQKLDLSDLFPKPAG